MIAEKISVHIDDRYIRRATSERKPSIAAGKSRYLPQIGYANKFPCSLTFRLT